MKVRHQMQTNPNAQGSLGCSHLIFPENQKKKFRNPKINCRLMLPFNHFARQFMGRVLLALQVL